MKTLTRFAIVVLAAAAANPAPADTIYSNIIPVTPLVPESQSELFPSSASLIMQVSASRRDKTILSKVSNWPSV